MKFLNFILPPLIALALPNESFADEHSGQYSALNLGVSLAGGLVLGTLTSESDKQLHFWAGSTITGLSTWSLNQAGLSKPWASVTGLALGILAGYAKEEYDRGRGKPFDNRDWGVTTLGSVSSVGLINIPW